MDTRAHTDDSDPRDDTAPAPPGNGGGRRRHRDEIPPVRPWYRSRSEWIRLSTWAAAIATVTALWYRAYGVTGLWPGLTLCVIPALTTLTVRRHRARWITDLAIAAVAGGAYLRFGVPVVCVVILLLCMFMPPARALVPRAGRRRLTMLQRLLLALVALGGWFFAFAWSVTFTDAVFRARFGDVVRPHLDAVAMMRETDPETHRPEDPTTDPRWVEARRRNARQLPGKVLPCNPHGGMLPPQTRDEVYSWPFVAQTPGDVGTIVFIEMEWYETVRGYRYVDEDGSDQGYAGEAQMLEIHLCAVDAATGEYLAAAVLGGSDPVVRGRGPSATDAGLQQLHDWLSERAGPR